MNPRDDDFLMRADPSAESSRRALEHGSSGYAEGLRRTTVEHRGDPKHRAYVAGAVVMGAAVVAAAALAVLVLAGVFAVTSGVGGRHRAENPEKQSPGTSTVPSAASIATEPPTPGAAAEAPAPSSNPAANPDTAVGAQVPAPQSSDSSGSQQLAPASTPAASDAAATASPTLPATCQSSRAGGASATHTQRTTASRGGKSRPGESRSKC